VLVETISARSSRNGGSVANACTTVNLDDVGALVVTVDADGCVTGGSPSGRRLLTRLGAGLDTLPAPLPPALWQHIQAREPGVASQWRSGRDADIVLGCTRYPLGRDGAWILLMSEISQKQSVIAQRLHQQRLESIGRLVATTAHDLRSPLSSIVFNSDSLATRLHELTTERVRETVADIQVAASRLRSTIDTLLDYLRLGPQQAPSQVTLTEVLERMQRLLRPLLRAGDHQLVDHTSAGDRILGNPLAVEQIFVNLVLNSIEAGAGPVTIRFSSRLEGPLLRVLVEDDGSGIAEAHRLLVFDPFFTTKRDGTGIGLTAAREAARGAGGDLQLVRWTDGCAFAVLLPALLPARHADGVA
jgi:signal transduction histidine kinase